MRPATAGARRVLTAISGMGVTAPGGGWPSWQNRSESRGGDFMGSEKEKNQFDACGLSKYEVSASPFAATASVETEMVRLNLLCPADSLRTAGQDEDHIRTLVDLDGQLPPIIAHRQSMRVIDGMHRLMAGRLRGRDKVNAV